MLKFFVTNLQKYYNNFEVIQKIEIYTTIKEFEIVYNNIISKLMNKIIKRTT